MMQSQKTDRANPGVKCQVSSCYYHMSGDRCSANQIEVLPRDAATSPETDCGTFTSK